MFINFKKINPKSPLLLLIIILTAAFFLRLGTASLLPSYTFDEVVSVSIAEKSLAQIWSYAKWEMHPPLHFYYLHFWLAIFGASEISARLSSIFLSLLAIIVLYFLGKEIFQSRLAGLSAAALYAFSPLFCFYGMWARMYTMLFLTAALSFLFFLKFIKARGRQIFISGAFFTFFTLAALLTHLTAGLVLVIELAYLIYFLITKQSKIREIVKKFFIPFFIIAIAYGSWFWYFWHFRLKVLGGNAWYFNTWGKVSFLPMLIYDSLRYLTPFDQYFFNLLAFSLLMILGFSAFAAISLDREKGLKIRTYFSNGVFFSLAIFLISFIGLFIAKLYVLRYVIMPAIGFFLLLGYGFSRLQRSWQIAILLIFSLLSLASFQAMARASLVNENWKGTADFISQNEKPGDKIITSLYFNLLPLNFYYRGKLPAAAPLDEKYRGDDLLRTAIKTNIYPTTDQNNINQLDDFLGDSQRIFLIISNGGDAFPDVPKIVEDWLESRGFVKIQEWPGTGSGSSLVWLMEKNVR